jgi:hypothetical protein
VVKKKVVAAAASVSSTEAFSITELALHLEVPTEATSIPSLQVGEEYWNSSLNGRLEMVVACIKLSWTN